MKEAILNKKCIFRGDRSGVFYGTLTNVSDDFKAAEIKDCRRLWYWAGANSISDLAIKGTKKPKNCNITKAVERIVLTDVIEIIPCTDVAISNIESVKEWTY